MAKSNADQTKNTTETVSTTPPSSVDDGTITYDTREETTDTVVGRIIRLGPNAAMWRSENKTIELSLFTGKITALVTTDVTLIEREQILSGLRAGTIVYSNKEETIKPSRTLFDDSTDAIKARLFLDNPNAEAFKKELSTIRSRTFLERCIEVYETEYRSTPRLKDLKEQLEKIS